MGAVFEKYIHAMLPTISNHTHAQHQYIKQTHFLFAKKNAKQFLGFPFCFNFSFLRGGKKDDLLII
jgi:hypothetical protein